MLYICYVDFRDNPHEFEDFALGVLHSNNLNDLMEVMLMELLSYIYFCCLK